ncbi:PRTRC system ThiF family protein [Arsenicibacter rosenii]|uniref:THIF-type NAD/FAD binding fold domain-containing protein n=1 Tax=Arsenicibacter rosenii TaxID=1750698 RepID=A0A1S2VC15_9BACT|nr:PRTRC system ThiF family protein [Arsenicibacter rosenii]OIN55855.1 hypothetical protein BLX24_27760 [Arsenicibacter rosenii]
MRVHITNNYLINPTNPVSVNLIGAGGTGSQVLTALARMNHSLLQLDHPGIYVRLWDEDTVWEANLGRQLFAEAELGINKALALISRVNRFFGTTWQAQPERFTAKSGKQSNLFITCVDTVSSRFEVAEYFTDLEKTNPFNIGRDRPLYWLDFGNSKESGQVVLATVGEHKQPKSQKFVPVGKLPFITEEWGEDLSRSGAEDDTPSCSLAEALQKQDLFINSTLAQMGSALLWQMFRQGMTENRGFFLNLADFRTMPIKI